METKRVNIAEIRVGDTVLHEGHLKTVGKGNLTHDSFMGFKLWGDSYKCGYEKVVKVIFPKFNKGVRI